MGDPMNIRSRMGALQATAAILFLCAFHVALCGDTIHHCPDSAFLRDLLLHDLKAAPATQSFYVGPLRDGRTLRIDGYYVDLQGVGIASIKPIADNRYQLRIDRTAVVKSILVSDAGYLCQNACKPVCRRFFEYVREISAANRIERLTLIDQQFSHNSAEICRIRSGSPYPASLLDSAQTVLRQAMLHELGHVVLKSTASSNSSSPAHMRAIESEADGFAAMTLRIARLAPAIPDNLLLDVMASAPTENSTHPPAWCRLNALMEEIVRWESDHPPDEGNDHPRHRLSDLLREYGQAYPQLRGVFEGRAIDCSSYDQGYSRGLASASRFIDENTRIEATPPP